MLRTFTKQFQDEIWLLEKYEYSGHFFMKSKFKKIHFTCSVLTITKMATAVNTFYTVEAKITSAYALA